MSHEARAAVNKLLEEVFLQLFLSLGPYLVRDFVPESSQDDDVLVCIRAAKILEHPQVATRLAAEPRIGNSLEVYETVQFPFFVITV